MRYLTLVILSLVLTGCAGLKQLDEITKGLTDYVLGGEDNTEPPKELVAYEQEIEIDLLWEEQNRSWIRQSRCQTSTRSGLWKSDYC